MPDIAAAFGACAFKRIRMRVVVLLKRAKSSTLSLNKKAVQQKRNGMDTLAEITQRMKKAEGRNDFPRLVQLLAKHGNYADALEEAQATATPRVQRFIQSYLKGAVAGGTTFGSDWAQDLAETRPVTDEFMSLLSSQELIGRLAFTRVPFNTNTVKETAPGAAAWTAEGQAIAVCRISLDKTTLEHTKQSGLYVLTKDLARVATAASLSNIRNGMLAVMRRTSDQMLLDPNISAVANKNPASLTNGASEIGSTGATEAALTTDFTSALQVHTDAGSDLNDVVIVAHPATLLTISTVLTSGGQRAFPTVGVKGGTLFGLPVFSSVGAVSSGSPSGERVIAFINAPRILLADNREIEIGVTTRAAIQMDDAPTGDTATGSGTSVVSLWQTESVGIRFTRRINFERSFDTAVSFLRVTF